MKKLLSSFIILCMCLCAHAQDYTGKYSGVMIRTIIDNNPSDFEENARFNVIIEEKDLVIGFGKYLCHWIKISNKIKSDSYGDFYLGTDVKTKTSLFVTFHRVDDTGIIELSIAWNDNHSDQFYITKM